MLCTCFLFPAQWLSCAVCNSSNKLTLATPCELAVGPVTTSVFVVCRFMDKKLSCEYDWTHRFKCNPNFWLSLFLRWIIRYCYWITLVMKISTMLTSCFVCLFSFGGCLGFCFGIFFFFPVLQQVRHVVEAVHVEENVFYYAQHVVLPESTNRNVILRANVNLHRPY